MKSISEKIIDHALNIGLDACGITDTQPLYDQANHLKQWLEMGYNGTMKYMENYFNKRQHPSLLVENSKSVIVVLLNYKPSKTIPTNLPQVSKYAYGTDYHFVVKNRLNKLLEYIKNNLVTCDGTAFVDSAPVMEKALAVKAGLGWIGKNSLLINPVYGSMTFIGTLFLNVVLEYNKTIIKDGCGNCNRCINICPTKAIVEPYVINANRCISYLNKTHKGEIPEELKIFIGNRLWGCDSCIDVCPYNKKTPVHNIPELMPQNEIFSLDISNISKRQLKKLIMRKPQKNS